MSKFLYKNYLSFYALLFYKDENCIFKIDDMYYYDITFYKTDCKLDNLIIILLNSEIYYTINNIDWQKHEKCKGIDMPYSACTQVHLIVRSLFFPVLIKGRLFFPFLLSMAIKYPPPTKFWLQITLFD